MKRFCVFLVVTGGALWWLCGVGLVLEHPIFFTVLFALALSLSLTAALYVFDLCCTVEELEKRIRSLEAKLETAKDSRDKENNQ